MATPVLDVAYLEFGPPDGPPVVLLHGFPYDARSYLEAAPPVAAAGAHVVVPYLRGFGPAYAAMEDRLAARPPITVPTVSLAPDSDGFVLNQPDDGPGAVLRALHRPIARGVGRNPPQEQPDSFAAAVRSLLR